nr:immunoglobulin heavy chain junction region [Mus musculus]
IHHLQRQCQEQPVPANEP